jgi:hypothetical protein
LLWLQWCSGCAVPTYAKSVTYKYDADGKFIGKEVTETIAQPQASSSPMKVGITKKNEIEK